MRRDPISQVAFVRPVEGIDPEADAGVIAARKRAGELFERWSATCDEIEAVSARCGIQPGRRLEPAQLDKLIVAALVNGRDPINLEDIERLQTLANTERPLYEAARQAAQAVAPALEDAKRKLRPAVAAALKPAVRAFAVAWLDMLRAGVKVNEGLQPFRDHGWHWLIPNLAISPGENLATNHFDAAQRIRDLIATGVVGADEVADLLPQS